MSGEIFVVGLSHHTAPLEVRERLSVATEAVADEVRHVLTETPLVEGILVSTCNRVELYGSADDPVEAARAIRRYLAARATPDPIESFLYERWGHEAVHHAFRVAASLDSMVVGEPQILGQVKSAYDASEAAGGVGTLLHRCFTRAFAVAKRVRTETDIAAGTVSVSSVAVELAQKIFSDLGGRRALLVGAGEMGEAAAKALTSRGVKLVVVNRNPDRSRDLARSLGVESAPYEELSAELTKADVVVTSTASPRFVLTRDLMQQVVKSRRRRPLFVIDIAVPRDVDPRVGDLQNIFLYDVDDLQEVAGHNLAARRKAAEQAEGIVREESDLFERWRRSLALTPTIVGLRERFRAIVRAELERTVPRLGELDDKQRKTLDAMTEAMVNKLLHHPLTELKRGAEGPDAAHLIDATRRLFDLAEPGPERATEGERAEADERASEPDEPVGELAPAGRGGERS